MRRTLVKRLVSLAVAGVVLGVTFAGGAAFASHQWNDVPTNNFFHNEIGWLVDQGIANGFVATGEFKPRDNILRQQAALWFANYNSALELVKVQENRSANDNFYLEAVCPAGKRAVAGGGDTGSTDVFMTDSGPTSGGQNPGGWKVRWETDNGVNVSPTFVRVWALCIPFPA